MSQKEKFIYFLKVDTKKVITILSTNCGWGHSNTAHNAEKIMSVTMN